MPGAPLIGVTTFGGDGGVSGISQYIVQLLKALAAEPREARYEVAVYADERSIFVPESPRVTPLVHGRAWASPIRNVAWHQAMLPALCKRRGFDVLFLPAANRRLPVWTPCPAVGTVHDLASAHVTDKYDPARVFYVRRVLPPLIRRLDHVLTVSEATKRDLVEIAGLRPERVTVTPLAADPAIFHPGDRDAAAARVASRFGVSGPYIVYIARLEHPGKNHVRLIRAFDRLKTRTGLPHKLVLAGSDRERAAEVHAEAAAARHAADIAFTGFVPSDAVGDLYRAADLFAFPSLFEGFGLPLLEAMACGTPVVAADVASLPEVAGDAARLVDPYDEHALAAALEAVLTDPALRADLVARGLARSATFSWRRTARQTLDVLLRLAP